MVYSDLREFIGRTPGLCGGYQPSAGVKGYAVTNSNFSFVILGSLTGAKNFSGYT